MGVNTQHLLSQSFCGLGIWVQLSWLPVSVCPTWLWSRCQLGCRLIRRLDWGKMHFQAHGHVGWQDSVSCWRLAGGFPDSLPHVPRHRAAPSVVTCIPQSGRESERRRGSQRPQSLRDLVSGVTSHTCYCFLFRRTFHTSWPMTVTSAEKFEVSPYTFMQWPEGGFGQKYVFDSWERGKKGEGGSLRDSRLTVRSQDALRNSLEWVISDSKLLSPRLAFHPALWRGLRAGAGRPLRPLQPWHPLRLVCSCCFTRRNNQECMWELWILDYKPRWWRTVSYLIFLKLYF